METNKQYKYFAFISYKREDEEWAIWMQHELEYYHLPALLNGRDDLPKTFHPVFRDIDELKAGNLPEQIHEALASSLYLIVICSPRSARSEWVNKEIEIFVKIGKERGVNYLKRVFPFIVEGAPHAKDDTQECFPKVLRDLPADEERIGGNVNESGRDMAFIKVMAGMLPNVSMDMLWNRYERDKAEEERRKREERDRLLIMQSRLISEIADNLVKEGNPFLAARLAIEILPQNLDAPERPYTTEAERALRNALSHNTLVLKRHTSWVNYAVFSPDGRQVVSASDDGTIRVWDSETGKQTRILDELDCVVHSATFSPDGRRIISASDDGIHIWDADSGNKINILEGHTDRVNSALFSHDGRRIVSASDDKTVRIWDAKTCKELHKLDGHTDSVLSAAFSPDGRRIVSASNDKTIRIWDADTGKETKIIMEEDAVNSASFSPEGKFIASASESYICIWDAETGMEIKRIDSNPLYNLSANFSPDGRRIVSASWDKKAYVWDVAAPEDKEELNVMEHSAYVNYAVFSPDGKRIVSASNDMTVRIWDAETHQVVITPQGYRQLVSLPNCNADNEVVLSASDDRIIRICKTKTGEEIHVIQDTTSVQQATFSSDGKSIVSITQDGVAHIWPFPPLQDLIDQTRERFKDRPLTPEERKMYYLE